MGKIVSIHSFRGGTGRSNIAANLAAITAMSGKRVAIVDADIQSPGIHFLFGLDKKMGYTLTEYLRGDCKIEDAAFPIGENVENAEPGVKKLAGKHLWLIPSSIDSSEIGTVHKKGYDVNVLNKGMRNLRKGLELDYLFIYTHPGLNEETLLSIAITDILLVVLRTDQRDFQGTAVTVDIGRGLNVPAQYLVINNALSKYDFSQIREAMEATYKTPVAGVLPLSEEVADLGSSDIFALRFPDHPVSRELRAIAESIMGS